MTAETDAAGDVALRPSDDPYLVEAAEAWRTAQADELTSLRAGAEKWTAGIASLLGLLGVLGIGLQTDRIAGLTGSGKTTVASLIAAVVILGGFAVVQGCRAAYGWPRTRTVTSDQDLISWYSSLRALPLTAAVRLRGAVIAAGAALAAVTAAAMLPWLLPAAAPPQPGGEGRVDGPFRDVRDPAALSDRRPYFRAPDRQRCRADHSPQHCGASVPGGKVLTTGAIGTARL
ncbi:hypothetical protein [Streptomyces coelicoflavus]|uniref:hypothetical protein n=1 Tax=Streptomyces coelicoflavus TaxID=285562 RepID=UPI003450CF30